MLNKENLYRISCLVWHINETYLLLVLLAVQYIVMIPFDDFFLLSFDQEDMSRDMWFPTMWRFDKYSLNRASIASF